MTLSATLVTRPLPNEQLQHGVYVFSTNVETQALSLVLRELTQTQREDVEEHEYPTPSSQSVNLWCYNQASALSIHQTIEGI